MSVIWLNGELIAPEQARVPALDRGLLSGVGLFETLRAYGGRPWAFDDHYDRLRAGGELIGLDIPDTGTLQGAIDAVLRGNDLRDGGVRFTVTGGDGPPDPRADADGPPNVIVTAWELPDYTDLYRDGVSLFTIAEGGRPLAGIKTTSYAVSHAARVAAGRAGADDALFLGGHKRILEATGSNVLVVRGNEVRTPSLADAILPGVTRHHVMEVARKQGFRVGEATLYMDDLLAADEVVLTSSLREVYPARSVDGQPLTISGKAAALRDAYRSYISASMG